MGCQSSKSNQLDVPPDTFCVVDEQNIVGITTTRNNSNNNNNTTTPTTTTTSPNQTSLNVVGVQTTATGIAVGTNHNIIVTATPIVPFDEQQQQQRVSHTTNRNHTPPFQPVVPSNNGYHHHPVVTTTTTTQPSSTPHRQQQQQQPRAPNSDDFVRHIPNESNTAVVATAAFRQLLPTTTGTAIATIATASAAAVVATTATAVVVTHAGVVSEEEEEEERRRRPDIILPTNTIQFTCSINGRNGYSYQEIYDIGTKPEDILGEGSFGKVYKGRHKNWITIREQNQNQNQNIFTSRRNNNQNRQQNDHNNTDHGEDNDNYDDNIDQNGDPYDLLLHKKRVMFGSVPKRTSSGSNSRGRGCNQNHDQNLNSQSDHENHDDDNYYVAIKSTKPTALDTRGGRSIVTYDDVESKCSEIRMLLRLRGDGEDGEMTRKGKNGTTTTTETNQGSTTSQLPQRSNPRDSKFLYLYEYFYNGTELYVVTELLGQELDQWRQQFANPNQNATATEATATSLRSSSSSSSTSTTFLERDVMAAAKSILQGIDYMHKKCVVHRDIKLQNILFPYNSNDPKRLKIVDFGLAKILETNQATRDFCGSLGYIAPEIYQKKSYRFEVDMFSFGVLLFRLLSGERPFPSNNQEVLQRHTIDLRYNVHGVAWRTVSSEAKDLIRRLLINRQERYTAEECLQHEWFQQQGTSILRPDYSQLGDGDSRSRAFALSHEPISTADDESGSRFWIDGILQYTLGILASNEMYHGRIVDVSAPPGTPGDTTNEKDTFGMICVQEVNPTDIEPIPVYIGRRGSYTEMDCRFLCRQIAQTIKCMHENGMAHRNLHLENILADQWGKVSVKGFQFAQAIEEGRPLTGHFGYLYSWFAFKAPEVDTDFIHDHSVDLWSLGAIVYMLLTGLPPFRGTGVELIEAKRQGEVKFDIVIPSDEAQALVHGLLQVHPDNRLTIEEVLHHEWMTADDEYLEHYDLSLALSMMQMWKET